MKKFFVLTLLGIAKADMTDMTPKCVTIYKFSYEEEVLKGNISGAYHLAIDHDTNTLFFSYTVRKISNDEKQMPTFEIGYLKLSTREFGTVAGIHGGFATAVNSKAHVVYMGGEDGLYRYDYNTNTANNLKITSSSIWQMFYRNGLYFTTYPEQKVYFYDNGQVDELPEFKGSDGVKLLAVRNNNSYIFSNNFGLYTYDKAKGKTFKGNFNLNGFTSDVTGNLYFSTTDAIYFIKDTTDKIIVLSKFKDIFGFVMERNGHMIYSNDLNIIRLKASKRECRNGTPEKEDIKVNII